MKNIRLHLIVLVLIVVSELIGVISIPIGIGKIVLLPMLYALILGIVSTIKVGSFQISREKEVKDASKLVSITLMLLMAKYGTIIGPSFTSLIKTSPALILQEFGNLGTVFIGIPIAVLIGLKRESIGGAHSIAREANVSLISDKYGLDSDEGKGVLGVYLIGTVFGTIFLGLLASILASTTPLHPYALAMASGVGSASMMSAAVGTLREMFPTMAKEISTFGSASNTLSGIDGIYMSVLLALPLSEWLYRKMYRLKYKTEVPGQKEE